MNGMLFEKKKSWCCSSNTVFVPLSSLCCHACWSLLSEKEKKKKTLTSLSAQSSHQKAAKSYKSVWLLLPEAFTPQYLRRHEMAPMQNKNKKKVLWGLQTTCTSCFLGYDIIEKRTIFPLPLPNFLFNFFLYMYELYSVCASLLCWTRKRLNKNKKDDKSITERIKKRYIGGILITSFKLPVFSCSQLLKITGFKNTIYNVLALDRCSTCVTVLIYETKMVTVNYVFLCAFFFLFFFKAGEKGCRDMAAADARVRKKLFLFFGGI